MEDEEFEKYFERVKEIFGFDGYIANMIYTDEEQKQKLKQILEEIYQKGHDENVHYQLLKALTKKEAKDDEL